MDAETERLIERTRQRRELLNQKMGKTPEAAPRKRRTPLAEDFMDNIVKQEASDAQQTSDDSPKRQCLRDEENRIKPDTPAIPSVRSRLHDIASQRHEWSDVQDEDKDPTTPVPTPRKSLSSPPEKPRTLENGGTSRKTRFAKLAQNIDQWEDDLSHPTIVKEVETKPRWQPPKAKTETAVTLGSSKKGPAPPPPAEAGPLSVKSSLASPKRVPAPVLPHVKNSESKNSPVRSNSKVELNSSPRPYKPYEQNAKVSPVKSPVTSKSSLTGIKAAELPKEKAVQLPFPLPTDQPQPKVGEMSKSEAMQSGRPLSTRLANWEQKITETKKLETGVNPKPDMTTHTAQTPKKMATPARPLNSTSDRHEEVQMRPKVRKSVDDEPTAHSVSARMSAWEQLSSANAVSDIKKVQPGACTPSKTPLPKKSPTKQASVTPGHPLAGSITHSKNNSLANTKSFQERIRERASEINPSAGDEKAGEALTFGTDSKLSPSKASPAMKTVQQKLLEQTQSTDMAQRLRQERMAEVQSIQNRWKNGLLKEGDDTPQTASEKRQASRVKARADGDNEIAMDDNGVEMDADQNFENKLSAMGFEVKQQEENEKKVQSQSQQPPRPPPPPSVNTPQSNISRTDKPQCSTSLFGIVSKKKETFVSTTPALAAKGGRKVKFDDSFDSDNSEASSAKKSNVQSVVQVTVEVSSHQNEIPDSDSTDVLTETTDPETSEGEVVLRHPCPAGTQSQKPKREDDEDLSLSAFVPASVRRQSILPSPQRQTSQNLDSSLDSTDSFEVPGAGPDIHKSTVDLVRLGKQYSQSSSSLTSQSTAGSTTDLTEGQSHSGYCPEDTDDSTDNRDAIADLLNEAMDSDKEDSPVVLRRRSHLKATQEDGDLPFTLSSYRASRNSQIAEVKQTIVRNSKYANMHVEEEPVEMPTPPVPTVSRQSIHERIKELQELVQQEQNVIMQTSNALNQCFSNSSYFAGSAEQVECNRLLLIACQKRQAFMTEIQRLKNTGSLDPAGPGPKGSLTISDIRLPLKKDFVTKIGTSQDTTTYYFILVLRNGPQLICTQMLSTHDPMMRGSLDFPNLIKINGITGSFKLNLDIYSMSVSREPAGKDKKKKTPKKGKAGSSMTVPSPGGPMAVHTTSFTQVTSVQLTMKSLDRNSFQLERLPFLSPLHGTIYLNLKCLMEANVEEKGFLTMFEDVSGLGSWHRRWCVLAGNKLQFWKYPDDETRKDPMGYIDLKRCITEKVGLIARDICARPHTFELLTVRQPRRGEKDTLITKTYNTMTTVRYMLSADTKEERIVWCNKLNRALANIRTWHADALRPASK